jgi:hypothetical protein
MKNPALRQQDRDEAAVPIPLQQDASILDWLEGTGRLLARDNVEELAKVNEEEISDLMGADDSYDDDDDDDLDVEED